SFRIDDTGPGDPALSGGGVFEVASANIPDNLNDRALDTGLNIAAGEEVQISTEGSWCFLTCESSCYSPSGRASFSGGVPTNDCQHKALIARIGGSSSLYTCIGAGTTFHRPMEASYWAPIVRW